MGTGGLSLLVLALDTGQSFDQANLFLGQHVRGIALFLPLSLLRDRPQQLEVAPGAKLLQTAFPLPHGCDADRSHLSDITHRGGHLSRDAIEVGTDAGLIITAKVVPHTPYEVLTPT
jgi:hypothetical protein